MSKKTYNIKPLGLNTNSNPIALPRGAMSKALDVSLTRPGILESRANYNPTPTLALPGGASGFDCPVSTGPGGVSGASVLNTDGIEPYFAAAGVKSVTGSHWNGMTLGSGLAFELGTLSLLLPNGTITTFPSPGPLTGAFAALQNSFVLGNASVPYIGTSAAPGGSIACVAKIESAAVGLGVTAVSRKGGAGQCEALTPTYVSSAAAVTSVSGITITSTTPLSTQLSSTKQAAYRVLFAHKDPAGNLIRGEPSGRLIVYGPANNYLLFIPLPALAFVGDILQVYRSEIIPTGTSEPSDEMRQVWERIITSTDVTNGYVVWNNDVTPDSIRGPALYTNDSQQGILQAESRPPNCSFGEYFKNVAWYGGVAQKNKTILLSILGIDSWTAGVTTFTVTALAGAYTKTITAAAAENLSTGQFLLDTTSATASLKLFNTARSICRVLSWGNANVFASYITNSNDISAQIVLKTVYVSDESDATITSNASVGTISPDITSATSFSVGGKNNYVYFSKPNQPEAVPDVNYVSVGVPGSGVLGLKSVGDSLIVFKQEGLYRIVGTTADTIRVEEFDRTVRIQPGAFRSIARGGNRIFCVCNQGVASIGESGVEIISTPIDDIIGPYKNASNTATGTTLTKPYPTIGACSESSHEYFLLLTDVFSATTTTQRLMVYSFERGMWYEWTPGGSSVTPPGTFATGICKSNSVTYGEKVAQSICDSSRFATYFVNILAPATLPRLYATTPTFTYCMDSGEAPDTLQRFESVKLITVDSSAIGAFTFTFSSDSGAAPESITITNGSAPGMVRCDVPRAHAVCGQLTVRVSCTSTTSGKLVVYGMIISYEDVSDWMNSRNNT